MATSPDAQQGGNTSMFGEYGVEMPRLFNLDLPQIKKTGQALPEQGDVSAIHSVLDIACRNGEWAIAAAQAYPHMQIVGIDSDAQAIDSARAQAEALGVKNVNFTAIDPFQRLDISGDSFDLVNARFIVGFIPAEAWSRVLREFLRVTRPGGYVRLTENDLPISSNPAFAKFGGMISQALYMTKRSFSPNGRLLSVTPALKRLLEDAGCENTRQAVYLTNFSAGMEAHAEISQDFSKTYRLVQPFLVTSGVTTQEEVEQAYQEMQAGLQLDDFNAVGFYLTTWGRKP
jgi:ubiquinone/menaquinone biosynthesis C-methylase UbiE